MGKQKAKENEDETLPILIKLKGPLRDAFERCRDDFGLDEVPNTTVVVTAIRQYLERKGYLKPKTEKEEE